MKKEISKGNLNTKLHLVRPPRLDGKAKNAKMFSAKKKSSSK